MLVRQRMPVGGRMFCLSLFTFFVSVYAGFYWGLCSSFLNLLSLIHRKALFICVHIFMSLSSKQYWQYQCLLQA